MSNWSLYVLKDPITDLVRYVGISKNVNQRFAQHLYKKNRTRKQKWISSLRDKGLVPVMEVIEDNLTAEDAGKKEIQYILLFKAMGAILVNGTKGGEGTVHYDMSELGRKKISNVHKGHTFNRGRVHSEESKKRMSEAHRGYVMPESQKIKIGLGNHGKKRSPEFCIKMSLAHKGRKHSDATKEIFSKAQKKRFADGAIHPMTGRKMSLEHKEKLRLINSTRIISDKERANKSRITSLWWKNRKLNKEKQASC